MMDCKQFRHELGLAADGSDEASADSEAGLASGISPAARLHLLTCPECQKFAAEFTEAMQALQSVAFECRLSDLSSFQRERFRGGDAGAKLPTPGHEMPVTLQSLAEHLPDRTCQSIPLKSWADMKQAAGLSVTTPANQEGGIGHRLGRKTSSAGWYPAIAVMAASVLITASLTNPLIFPDGSGDSSGNRVATRNLFTDPRFQNLSSDYESSPLMPVSLEQQWTTPPVMPEFPQEVDLETQPDPRKQIR